MSRSFLFFIVYFWIYASSFSQDVASCYNGGYVSGVDTILFHFYFEEDYSENKINEVKIHYFSFRKPEFNRDQNLSCKIINSEFFIIDDSGQETMTILQGDFFGDSTLLLTRFDFLYYPSNGISISLTACPTEKNFDATENPFALETDEIDEENSEEIIYDFTDESPEFPGGAGELRPYFNTNMLYPTYEKEEGIQGTVYVQFVVEKDGSITHAIVLRGESPGLDKEALRLIKSMPKWIPAKQNGNIVRSRFTVPITFRIE